MPSADINPAAGTSVMAAAQVLLSKVVIVRAVIIEGLPTQYLNFGPRFGEAADLLGVTLRSDLAVPANNLSSIWVNVFQFPEYDRGDIVFRARTDLSWRPVFRMPTADWPDMQGAATNEWLPFCSPLLLTPNVPSNRRLCCLGASEVSIEIRGSAAALAADQGEDRIVVSISASQ